MQAQNTRYQAREGSVRVELLAAVPTGRQVRCSYLVHLLVPVGTYYTCLGSAVICFRSGTCHVRGVCGWSERSVRVEVLVRVPDGRQVRI